LLFEAFAPKPPLVEEIDDVWMPVVEGVAEVLND
jgi:hypothetical protein